MKSYDKHFFQSMELYKKHFFNRAFLDEVEKNQPKSN